MGPHLGYPATVHGHDAVRRPDGGEPVGDDEDRAAVDQPGERLLDQGLRAGVQGRGRLVQDQYPGVADQRAGDGEPLLLAPRQPRAALSDDRRQAVGQVFDEVERVRVTQGLADRLFTSVSPMP